MKNKLIKSISLLLMILVFGMVFIPAINAQADSEREEILKEEFEYLMDNSETIMETSNEKVVRFTSEDGVTAYSVAWRDPNNPNRVYFATVTDEEMLSSGISNEIASVNGISALASGSFGDGSYAETYGNSVTGGVHVYFSPDDAELAFEGSAYILGAAGAAITMLVPGVGQVLGPLVAILGACIGLYYLVAKNSDDSLDISIPYLALTYMTTGLPGAGAFITIGQVRYFFND
ncbi:hypothetical protein MsAg5_12670 [Methanosarcinaceae archaeon Ag5]|uniref:Uncharacterized protein n=1 Tax=Methanolapillus africanus TaxID=3028297 RepID=A0AAE4MK86_9EURY|nr:hypothetical protein [Methanosarcinaceae archaeon Ag5]